MTYLSEYRDWMFVHRDIETPCTRCGGFGRRAYSDTSTWRGGFGGQIVTGGVCDHCWGSGDELKPGANLRELFNKLDSQESELKRLRKEVSENGEKT